VSGDPVDARHNMEVKPLKRQQWATISTLAFDTLLGWGSRIFQLGGEGNTCLLQLYFNYENAGIS